MEFEFQSDGLVRYANDSQYKNDTLIRKEAVVNDIVLAELKRIIEESEIMRYVVVDCSTFFLFLYPPFFFFRREDDKLWPQSDREGGRQELEIVLGNEHICFTVKD